jgi:hypothetical protein
MVTTIIDTIKDGELFADAFKNRETWRACSNCSYFSSRPR